MLLETMGDLLLDQLRDLYSIETQIEVALPVMVDQTTSASLREALTAHFEGTEGQIVRLQEIFGTLGQSARGPRCLGIAGLLQEAEDTMRRATRGPVLDAVVIACLQRVEHYEMAVYSTALAYAKQLGQNHIAELLAESLAEETSADESLCQIAEAEVLEQGEQAGADAVAEKKDRPGQLVSHLFEESDLPPPSWPPRPLSGGAYPLSRPYGLRSPMGLRLPHEIGVPVEL